MNHLPRFLGLLSLVALSGCLTAVAQNGGSVTAGEARSLVAAYIGDKAWEIETAPVIPAPFDQDQRYFHFGVITDPETDERLDFYVKRTTGDLYESPNGPLVQRRAVLDKIRGSRLPGEYQDSLWSTGSDADPPSTLTLTNKSMTVEYRSLVLTGSVTRYSRETHQVVVEWVSLYDAATDTVTDLESTSRFAIERTNPAGPPTIRSVDPDPRPLLEFLPSLEWTRN